MCRPKTKRQSQWLRPCKRRPLSECLIATNTGHGILMTISLNFNSDKIHTSLNIRCWVLILRRVRADCRFNLRDVAFECAVLKQNNNVSEFALAGGSPHAQAKAAAGSYLLSGHFYWSMHMLSCASECLLFDNDDGWLIVHIYKR